MEHKQDHAAIGESEPVFGVTAIVAGPDIEEERLFLLTEIDQTEQEIASFKGHGMVRSLVGKASGHTLDELKHYRSQLALYEQKMMRFEQDFQSGLVPFRVIVANLTAAPEHKISAKVQLHDGAIMLTKTAPQRPVPPDYRTQHAPEQPSYNLVSSLLGGRFARSSIKLGEHGFSANLSLLEPRENVALINQTLFMELGAKTSMTFTISSAHHREITGEVQL